MRNEDMGHDPPYEEMPWIFPIPEVGEDMDKARKMCGRMEVWSRATDEELDILLQACNRNWRKPATLLSRRRVSNQHLRNRELYVEEVRWGPKAEGIA